MDLTDALQICPKVPRRLFYVLTRVNRTTLIWVVEGGTEYFFYGKEVDIW